MDAVTAMTGIVCVAGSARSWRSASNLANAGQLNIDQDEGGPSFTCQAYALFTRSGLDGLIAFELHGVAHQLEVLGIVLNDEDQLMRHDAPGS